MEEARGGGVGAVGGGGTGSGGGNECKTKKIHRAWMSVFVQIKTAERWDDFANMFSTYTGTYSYVSSRTCRNFQTHTDVHNYLFAKFMFLWNTTNSLFYNQAHKKMQNYTKINNQCAYDTPYYYIPLKDRRSNKIRMKGDEAKSDTSEILISYKLALNKPQR